jgi:hypothetical protein
VQNVTRLRITAVLLIIVLLPVLLAIVDFGGMSDGGGF